MKLKDWNECRKCKCNYDADVHNTKLPENMMIFGAVSDDLFPKCPTCGNVDFMSVVSEQPCFKK